MLCETVFQPTVTIRLVKWCPYIALADAILTLFGGSDDDMNGSFDAIQAAIAEIVEIHLNMAP